MVWSCTFQPVSIDLPRQVMISRRTMLQRTFAVAAAMLAPRGAAGAMPADPLAGVSIYRDLLTYDELGPHRTASGGDVATTEWLEQQLVQAGLAVTRQAFEVTLHEPVVHHVTLADRRVPGFPLWPPVPAPENGIRAELMLVPPDGPVSDLQGRIAVIRLPYVRRGVSLARPLYRRPILAALRAGAAALLLITEGPTGDLIALNALPPGELADEAALVPMLLVAGKHGPSLEAAAREKQVATLELRVATRERAPAYNLIARLERGPRWIVLSTPQSGWFHCAGERGPGVATQLALARWAAARSGNASLCVLFTSGHELAGIGARQAFSAPALPAPAETALWIFLGSSIATRAWHLPENADGSGTAPVPLEHADPQRTLYGSPAVLERLRSSFAGVAGLEEPHPASAEGGPGSPTPKELREALAQGYLTGIGVKGNHLYQHAMGDRAHTTSAGILEPAARAFAGLLASYGV